MVMLDIKAYMDESGSSGDTDFVSIGGLVAAGGAWEMLEYQWREALDEFEITDFHMREYAQSVGQCKKWRGDEEKRREVYDRFIRLIYDAHAMPFGAVVPMAAYRQWSKEAKRAMRDPYFICLQYCLDAVVHRADYVGLPMDEKILTVFSQNTQFESLAGKYWHAMRKSYEWGERLGACSFGDPKSICALQAADVVAYEIRAYQDGLLKRPEPSLECRISEFYSSASRLWAK
jgi:hypothetical protein